MGEQAQEGGKKKSSWLKATGGAIGGLLSGAIMMYASPLIDKFVKPAKPVANFIVDTQGASATFHNISTGASEGWWDFGDGSALVPVVSGQESITHDYPNKGEFSAKLSVRNLLGDQDDRTTTVRISEKSSETPTISSLEVVPVSPDGYAPATFKVTTKVKGAQLCMLDCGDERPPIILNDEAQMNQEHLITFDKPGGYVVQMVAVNEKEFALKNDIAQVNVAPRNAITAVMTVTTLATRVEKLQKTLHFAQTFPAQGTDTSCKVDLKLPVEAGYEFSHVQLASSGEPTLDCKNKCQAVINAPSTCRGAKNLQLQVSPDKRSLRLTGELVKETSLAKLKSALPTLLVPVTVTQEKQSPASSSPIPVTASITTLPGLALLPLPPLPSDWVDAKRLIRLELKFNGQTIWQGSQLPLGRGAIVTVGKRKLLLTAVQAAEQVRLDLRDAPSGYTAN
jgi:hypothetical protein